MKVALFTLLAFGLIAVCRSAGEDYDYEDDPVAPAAATPPPPPAPVQKSSPSKLGGLLSPRGRAPAVGRKPSPVTTSTTTAKPVEQSEDEYDEEAADENQEQEEIPTTTTESSKKIRGGVRPFRSNEDLLAALKRRRAQVGTGSHSRESHVSTSEPVTQKPKTTPANRHKSDTTTPKTPGRSRFGAGSRGSKPVQEEVEETQRDEIQVKPKPYRRG